MNIQKIINEEISHYEEGKSQQKQHSAESGHKLPDPEYKIGMFNKFKKSRELKI